MDLLKTPKLFKKDPMERMTMTADLKWLTLLASENSQLETEHQMG